MTTPMRNARNSCTWLLRFSLVMFMFLAPLSPFAHAEHTRNWRQASYEDFLKGTAHGIAIRSDGRLELAPKFTLLADADASYLWSLRIDPKGILYAAGGSPAKVFRFDANGKPATAFESTDLVAQAIAFDGKDNLYVATSPDGKVYRVSPSGEKTVFFDPKTKYIWDLAFSSDGTLFVATGDKGQIFAVTPDGKSQLFYASDEAHIRVLGFDPHGNLLAGTEPSGRILRVTRTSAKSSSKESKEKDASQAEGFVLYETAKREVTALAVGPDGSIYVAAIGDKQHGPAGTPPTTVITTPQGTTTVTGGIVLSGGQPQGQTPLIPFQTQQLSSSIYRLSPEGAPEELWNSRDDVVYALALNPDGRLLAGTGNNGTLLAIDGHGVFAQLAKSGSAQITGIARGNGGRLFLCTANPGKVFSLGADYEPEGSYESRSFDAQLFSQWGRLDWWSSPLVAADKTSAKSAAKDQPRLEFFARSGNTEDPGKEWSRWFGPYTKPAAVECPAARFVQWKVVIHDGRSGEGVDWVSLAYLPRNVAPVLDAIAVQDPGVRAQSNVVFQTGQQPNVALRQPQTANPTGIVITQVPPTPPRFEQPPQGFAQKGYQSVLWSAHDDNEDDLRFSVYFRGESETEWKLLKDKLEQKFYSWDSTAMPDGAYYLKIVATDAPSNPPALALSTERESERFVVDNTPPVIEALKASLAPPAKPNADDSAVIKFTARDSTSSIERAQYSVDGGDWFLVDPVGHISDSLTEQYEFTVNGLSPGEHSIAVRAYDRFDNLGSAKVELSVPGSRR